MTQSEIISFLIYKLERMRTLVFIWVGVLGASLTYGQDLQKVLVKSFNLDAINQMKVDLQGKYEIIAWNNDYSCIVMSTHERD